MSEVIHNINFYGILKAFSAAIDLISKKLVGHHKQVAYIALMIGRELGLSDFRLRNLTIAALLHDLGVFYLNQNFDDFLFDNKDNLHAEVGYHLVREYFNTDDIPEIIRFHHHEWQDTSSIKMPEESQILFLADRITTLIQEKKYILTQVRGIEERIANLSGTRFWPEAVEAFLKVSNYEFFWLDAVNNLYLERQLNTLTDLMTLTVDLDKLIDFGVFFSHIIDFRSPFTATHSSGVAVVAEKLAELRGFSKEECKLMRVAGYLHDIGKLAVPLAILNKPGKLDEKERAVMKSHVYYTYQVLGEIAELQQVREWSAYHHERLDGMGYPFHLNASALSQGARLMAVVDVFTAIAEDRPYRKKMELSSITQILLEMAEEHKLDSSLVELLLDNLLLMEEMLASTQNETRNYFSDFKRAILGR